MASAFFADLLHDGEDLVHLLHRDVLVFREEGDHLRERSVEIGAQHRLHLPAGDLFA